MNPDVDSFLTQLIIDLDDVIQDIEFDFGSNSVAEEKLKRIIRNIEEVKES